MKSGLLSFPFLIVVRNPYLPVRFAFMDAHHQFSLGLSLSSTSMREAVAKLRARFHLNVQKQPVPESGEAS